LFSNSNNVLLVNLRPKINSKDLVVNNNRITSKTFNKLNNNNRITSKTFNKLNNNSRITNKLNNERPVNLQLKTNNNVLVVSSRILNKTRLSMPSKQESRRVFNQLPSHKQNSPPSRLIGVHRSQEAAHQSS
jgi:hypothetical protein